MNRAVPGRVVLQEYRKQSYRQLFFCHIIIIIIIIIISDVCLLPPYLSHISALRYL